MLATWCVGCWRVWPVGGLVCGALPRPAAVSGWCFALMVVVVGWLVVVCAVGRGVGVWLGREGLCRAGRMLTALGAAQVASQETSGGPRQAVRPRSSPSSPLLGGGLPVTV